MTDHDPPAGQGPSSVLPRVLVPLEGSPVFALDSLRRLVMVSLSAVLASVLLVVTPASAQAAAAPPIVPVTDAAWQKILTDFNLRKAASRVPGSVLDGASRGAPVSSRVAGVVRSVGGSAPGSVKVPTLPNFKVLPKFGTVVRGAGTVGLASFFFDTSYRVSSGALGYVPESFAGGYLTADSNGFVCDLMTVADSTAGCQLSMAPGVAANGDVVMHAPGWVPAPSLLMTNDGATTTYPASYTVTFDVQGAPAFGQLLPISDRPSGTQGAFYTGPTSASYGTIANSLTVFYRLPNGQMLTGVVYHNFLIRPNQQTKNDPGPLPIIPDGYPGNPGNSALFDHVEVQVNQNASGQSYPTQRASWYPEGHASRPVDSVSDPARSWQSDWTCKDSAGLVVPGSSTSAQFHETDATWPTPAAPVCPPGTTLSTVKVSEVAAGQPDAVLYEYSLDPAVSTWAAEHPNCLDGSCTLELSRLDAATGTRLACLDNPSLCTSWFESPDKLTEYVCAYGGQDVPLAECNLYAPTFKREAATGTETTAVPAYGDPLTGATSTPVPVSTAPAADCPPPFSPVQLLNPYYYYKGTQCALRDAFVPSVPMEARFAEVRGAYNASVPVVWVGALGGVFDGVELDEGGCRGPGGEIQGVEMYPFSACDEPMKKWAGVAKTFAGFFIGLAGLVGCASAIGRAFGYDFGPPPVPVAMERALF